MKWGEFFSEAFNKPGSRTIRLALSLLFITMATVAVMIIFQLVKHFLNPDMTMWDSHIYTIVFTGIVAPIIALFVLLKFEDLYRKISRENEGRMLSDEKISRLASIVTSSDNAIIGETLDGTITNWNRAAERLYGYSEAEAVGKSIGIIMPPDHMDDLEYFLGNIRHGEYVLHHETVRVNKDGRRIDVSINISPIFDATGKVIGSSAIARDVTESKRVEKELKKSRWILAKSQQIAHVGNWALNLQTKVLNWSDEGYRLFGYTPYEVQPSLELLISRIHPDDRHILEEAIDTAKNQNRLYDIDYRIIMPDGSIQYINSVADKIKNDSSGHPEWMYGIHQNITKRKQVEKELEEAKSQSDLYLDLMGHDINNSNQIALGYLELADDLVKSGGRLSNDNIELIEKPMTSLRNSSKLIDNVRKLQKVGSKQKTHDLCPRDVVEEAYKQFLGTPNVHFTYMIPQECKVTVQADELLIDAFTNIIGNAIKHNNGNLDITIRSESAYVNDKRFCKIMIEDNGHGIPDARKERLFNRFSRDNSKVKGSGLGLFLVKSLIESYGGKVWVEDRIKGDYTKGSRFVIMLPSVNNEQKCPGDAALKN
jgi:PAS domain S-box-containing protein